MRPHWIAFDASQAIREGGTGPDQAFPERIIAIASEEECAPERAGQQVIAIWKCGVTP